MIDATLHYATTMTMRCNLHTMVRNCVVDELIIVRFQTMNALLNYVIAV